MSCTELYSFNSIGNAEMFAEIRNSFRGARAIWEEVEKKYLPQYIPSYAVGIPVNLLEEKLGFLPSRTGAPPFGNKNLMDDIWQLGKRNDVAVLDKLVLMSTFDNVVVRKKNIKTLLKAMREFSGETSLLEQTEKIMELYETDNGFTAIAWNQTSVNSDVWCVWNEGTSENKPYNLTINEDHWFMFDCLEDYEIEELKNLGCEI